MNSIGYRLAEVMPQSPELVGNALEQAGNDLSGSEYVSQRLNENMATGRALPYLLNKLLPSI